MRYCLRHIIKHLIAISAWDEVEEVLCSIRFLDAIADSGLIFDLITDFGRARQAMPQARAGRRTLGVLEQALRRDLHFIQRHPTTVFQCLWNSCWWYDCPWAEQQYDAPEMGWSPVGPPWRQPGPKLHELLSKWRAKKEQADQGYIWVRSLRPPALALGAGTHTKLQGHEQMVRAVSFVADGTHVVSGSFDGTVRMWDVSSGHEAQRLGPLGEPIAAVTCSPTDTVVAVATLSGEVSTWNPGQRTHTRVLTHHKGVSHLAFSPNGRLLAVLCRNGEAEVWDIVSKERVAEFGADDHRIVVRHASTDGLTTAFEAPLGADVRMAGTPQNTRVGAIACLAFGQDNLLCIGWKDRCLALWDLQTGRETFRSKDDHWGSIVAVSLSTNGKWFASADAGGNVKIWDSVTGSVRHHCVAGPDPIYALATPLSEPILVGGSAEGTLYVWDVRSGACTRRYHGHESTIHCVAVSRDGLMAASGSDDGIVWLWNLSSASDMPRRREHRHPQGLTHISACHETRILSAHSETPSVFVWTTEGVAEAVLRGHKAGGSCVTLLPDCRLGASGCKDGKIRTWNLDTGAQEKCLIGHKGAVDFLQFACGGCRLVSASVADGTLRVWDLDRGQQISLVGKTRAWTVQHFMSRDERLLVAGCADGSVVLCDLKNGAAHCLPGRHSGAVNDVALSTDGTLAVSGGRDGALRSWDVISQRELQTLPQNRNSVESVAISPDTQLIAAALEDGTVRVWNTPGGEPVTVLSGHGVSIARLAFVPGDHAMLCGMSEGEEEVFIWDVRAGQLLETVKGAFGLGGVVGEQGFLTWRALYRGDHLAIQNQASLREVAWLPGRYGVRGVWGDGRKWVTSRGGGEVDFWVLEGIQGHTKKPNPASQIRSPRVARDLPSHEVPGSPKYRRAKKRGRADQA